MEKVTIFMIISFVIMWLILLITAINSEGPSSTRFVLMIFYTILWIYFIREAIELDEKSYF